MRNLLKNVKYLKNKTGITDKQLQDYLKLNDIEYTKLLSGDFEYTSDNIEDLSDLFMLDSKELIETELKEYDNKLLNNNLDKEEIEAISNINKIVKNQIAMDKLL